MKKTVKRFLIWLLGIALETIFGTILKSKLETMSQFIRDYFPELLLTVIAVSTLSFLIFWFIHDTLWNLNYLRIKTRYYDLMLTKFHDQYKDNMCSVYNDELAIFFKKKDKKYLDKFLNELEGMRILKKGTDDTFGKLRGKY